MIKCVAAVSSRKLVRLVTLETTKSGFSNSFLLNKLPKVMGKTLQGQYSTRTGV